MDRPVLSKRCDLTGNPVPRLFRHQLTARFIPLGNYRGGAGFRCLAILTVLHYLGRPLFHILIRFERQLAALYRMHERRRNRVRDGEKIEAKGE